jgi:DeoR/GlpR family transcriptional regulator of sugar metabolism
MSRKTERRRNEIVRLMEKEGAVYVATLSSLLKVTKETVRTDLDALCKSHGYRRIHGGLTKEKVERKVEHYLFTERKSVSIEAKKKLCYFASQLIKEGVTIYIDTGSTVSYLLDYLEGVRSVTVVTPSLAVLTQFVIGNYKNVFDQCNHQLVFIGGQVNGELLTTYGFFHEQMLKQIHIDIAFLSSDAIDIEFGLSNADAITLSFINLVLTKKPKIVGLLDASKFGYRATYRVLTLDALDYLITDLPPQAVWEEAATQHAFQLLNFESQ